MSCALRTCPPEDPRTMLPRDRTARWQTDSSETLAQDHPVFEPAMAFHELPRLRRQRLGARSFYDPCRVLSGESVNASRSAQLFRIVPQFWQINLHLISLTLVEPQTSQTSPAINRNPVRDRAPAPNESALPLKSSPLPSRRSSEPCRG